MKVAIVGASIGGLTLALLLNQRGIEAEVWEAVSEIKPLGVGINLLPHAVKELTELGLANALADIAIETSSLSYYNKFGQIIWHEPRGRAAGYGWSQFSIHRGDLQMILLRVAQQYLGDSKIHTSHTLESLTQSKESVAL